MQHWDNPLLVHKVSDTLSEPVSKQSQAVFEPAEKKPFVWDWAIEHEDRKKEAKSDETRHVAGPFQVDRKLLKDIVREKMGADVVRIQFLGAGAFTSTRYFWSIRLTLCLTRSRYFSQGMSRSFYRLQLDSVLTFLCRVTSSLLLMGANWWPESLDVSCRASKPSPRSPLCAIFASAPTSLCQQCITMTRTPITG